MRTVLLTILLSVVVNATAIADPYWKPCDYNVSWKTDGTSCG
jgi:hypothetical protein